MSGIRVDGDDVDEQTTETEREQLSHERTRGNEATTWENSSVAYHNRHTREAELSGLISFAYFDQGRA